MTPRKCVRMNTNNISQTPAGPKSRYLVFWAVTKEEPGRVDLSLTGEQRPAREKNYTHKHTDGNEDCRAAGMQSWGRGAGRWQARPVCVSGLLWRIPSFARLSRYQPPRACRDRAAFMVGRAAHCLSEAGLRRRCPELASSVVETRRWGEGDARGRNSFFFLSLKRWQGPALRFPPARRGACWGSGGSGPWSSIMQAQV